MLRANYYARRVNFHPMRNNPIIAIPSKTVVDPESGTAVETLTLSRISPMLLLLPSLWKLRLIVVGARTVNDMVSSVSGTFEASV